MVAQARRAEALHTTLPVQSTGAIAREGLWVVDWLSPESKRTLLAETSVTLGRDPGCSVELPGVEASRRHARLGWDGPALTVLAVSG